MNTLHKILGTFLMLLVGASVMQAQTARLQIIHNCADAAAASVDIWLDDGPNALLTNVGFREASTFIDAPAGTPFDVTIQPPNSTDTTNGLFRQTFTLAAGETYIVVASGTISPTGYSPATPFSLEVFDMGREASANGMMETDVLVLHGSTDAPTVDVYESSVPAGTLVDNASYGDFASYLELGTADYTLQVRNEQNSAIVAAYSAPLAGLSLGGQAITVLASGFLNPTVNSSGPAFGLFAATAAGGALVELPAVPIPTARVQVIHNAADAAAAEVDVWLNAGALVTGLEFREATAYVTAQAGVPFDVSIAAPNSMDTTGALAKFTYTLDEGETYQLIANGMVSTSGYSPLQPFNIDVFAGARESAMTAGNVDVLVYHGSTDAPTVEIEEIGVGAGTLVPAASYTDFAGYLDLAEADYVLNVKAGGAVVATFQAPLAGLQLADEAITVLASGFLDPTVNSGGADFGLWVALPAGGDLEPLPMITGIDEPSAKIDASISVYPNPSNGLVTIDLGDIVTANTQIELLDLSGRVLRAIPVNGTPQVNVDLQGTSQGVYLLRVSDPEGFAMRKIILE